MRLEACTVVSTAMLVEFGGVGFKGFLCVDKEIPTLANGKSVHDKAKKGMW